MGYTRVNWQDEEEGNTPLCADNLNIMDEGILDIDTELSGTKTDLAELDQKYNDSVPSLIAKVNETIEPEVETLMSDVSTLKSQMGDIATALDVINGTEV